MPSPSRSPGPHSAIRDGFGEVLRRIEIVPNSDPLRVTLTSDSPLYGRYEIELEKLDIVGRYIGRLTAD